ncbi:hypothetical protein HOLleu_31737 [Holothuria leucospilota]|uniref:Uncharacterized protein n=1 Tax=Holothuria leucospilota TaxID=206669 RepID=A0A9Q1BGG8_HOLLE|nr:hypothetical protein HOLleu_31737 [Holothuria leucospilota]
MTLLQIAGPETVELFKTFLWRNNADKDDPDLIMDQLEKYCNPRKNTTYERHIFNKTNQNPFESIHSYVTDSKVKAKTCEFGNLTDSLIRDRIVCGMLRDALRARLLREEDLKLEKAFNISRSGEASDA